MNGLLLKKYAIGVTTVLAFSGMGANVALAQHNPRPFPGYLNDSENHVVKNNYNECWRTGSWTPAMAIAECDPDLVKKPVAEKKAEAPAPAPAPTGPEAPSFERVTLSAETLFDFDKAVVRPEGKAKLDEVVQKMKDFPQVEVVLVTGHTDRIGTDAYNQALSERRAAAVKNYLVSKGIDANRIETVGKGETEPVVECKGTKKTKALVACLQPNRRVVVEIKVQRPSGSMSGTTGGSTTGTTR